MRTLGVMLVVAAVGAGAGAHGFDAPVRPIAGGTFEASGAVALEGGALFVDDGRANEVFWMTLDRGGQQMGTAQPVRMGAAIHDKEGITTDGTHIYVVGSQSNKASQGGAGLARFQFDAATKRVSDVQAIEDLRGLILAALPDVARAAGSKTSGFNIEGLAWDAANKRLMLGLRSPVQDGNALIITMRLQDPTAAFTRDNVVVEDSVMRLPLGGGIRSLEYDRVTRDFRILSAGEKDEQFSLWRWTGRDAPQRESFAAPLAAAAAKPEGVTRVGDGESSYTLVVFDTGHYAAMR
jgi:hypothetical protein